MSTSNSGRIYNTLQQRGANAGQIKIMTQEIMNHYDHEQESFIIDSDKFNLDDAVQYMLENKKMKNRIYNYKSATYKAPIRPTEKQITDKNVDIIKSKINQSDTLNYAEECILFKNDKASWQQYKELSNE